MLEKMKSAWRIPELRKKIIYTFGMLLMYRLLCVIPVPGINVSAVASAVKDYSILDFMNMMTGGSFQNMSIMAMGITPYINSSIILQLLTVVPFSNTSSSLTLTVAYSLAKMFLKPRFGSWRTRGI